MNLLTYVERLSVEFHWMTHKTWMSPYDWEDWEEAEVKLLTETPVAAFQGMEERIHDFWQRLPCRTSRTIKRDK